MTIAIPIGKWTWSLLSLFRRAAAGSFFPGLFSVLRLWLRACVRSFVSSLVSACVHRSGEWDNLAYITNIIKLSRFLGWVWAANGRFGSVCSESAPNGMRYEPSDDADCQQSIKLSLQHNFERRKWTITVWEKIKQISQRVSFHFIMDHFVVWVDLKVNFMGSFLEMAW